MSKRYKLRLPIPFVDGYARRVFANAFSDTFKGFPEESIVGLSEGRYFKIIGEGPMKAIAWWLQARGIEMKIIEIIEEEVTINDLGHLEV